jgi:hypothetical protein
MREQGLRPIQIWVPDTSRPGFAEETRAWVESLKDKAAEDALDEAMEAEMAAIKGWVWTEDR